MAKVTHITTESPSEEITARKPSYGTNLMPFEEFERTFDRFLEGFGFGPRGWLRPFRPEIPKWGELGGFEGRLPRVDMIDRDKEILVRAELPGVDKKDLDISLTDNTLTIHANMRHEKDEEHGEYRRAEIRRGEFQRTMTLPAEVKGDQAKAKVENGMLELTLPKAEAAKRRTIKVD